MSFAPAGAARARARGRDRRRAARVRAAVGRTAWSGRSRATVEYVEALGRETFLGVDGIVVQSWRAARRRRSATSSRYGLVREGLRFFDAQTGAARA